MATALKLKNDIKKLKAAISSKATPKSFVPKLKSQLEKAENELASMKKSGRPRKTSTTTGTKNTLTALQKLIQKKKFGVYQGAGVDLKKDAVEGALATGRRISKGLKSNQWGSAEDNKGNVYYEYRPNRLDVKQPKKAQKYPKLEKGGYMAKGGETGRYKIFQDTDGRIEQGFWGVFDTKENYLLDIFEFKKEAEGYLKEVKEKGANDADASKYNGQMDKYFEKGGYMAKDGVIYLKSVGTYFKPSDMTTSPEKEFKNEGEINYVYENTDEWWESLSNSDKKIIESFKNNDGGMMAKGGKTDMLKEDDYVWNAVGKKLVVDKVTDDEYYLSGFMQAGSSPWSKVKVHEYIKNGEWSLKPKMAGGGEMHKADYFKDGGKVFSEKELKEILDEALGHFYQGLNQVDLAMRYLEVKGQGGLKTPLSNKLKLDELKESIEKIEEYTSK